MPKFIITGPAKLSGEIAVRGAKNAALKILPAALLSEQPLFIRNLPNIEDIHRAQELLQTLGAHLEKQGRNLMVEIKEIKTSKIKPELANKFRASIMFVGPILARLGEVSFPHPGGCVIGAGQRPIDLFLDGFAALGAEIKIKNNHYQLKARRLRGTNFYFTTVSVTGTESLMLTAVLAEGTTVLKNCAMEPEISALAQYLNDQGARIKGAGTPTIIIKGVKKIKAGTYTIIPDRIETGTFAIMAAATKSTITITNCNPSHIEALLAIFKKIGINWQAGRRWLKILPSKTISAFNVKTHEYPGFPTDLQSPFTVLMTQANGSALIHETIYDRRLLFTDMLTQMGANITMCDPHRVVIAGPTQLIGKKLTSPDLRAGMAMLIAALIAQGTTEIDNIYQIDRGYEKIDKRLTALGAKIRRQA